MISIILVNYYSDCDIVKHIDNFKDNSFFRIIVVDNSDTLDFIDFSNVIILKPKENLGYAGGNNLAYNYEIELYPDNCMFVLNPDVTISIDSIIEMYNFISKVITIGQVYACAVDEFGNKLYDSINLSGLSQTWNDSSDEKSFIPSDYAAGSAFMFYPNRLKQKHLFDERYFLYWEEVDLSLRFRNNNLEIYCYKRNSCIRKTNSLQSIVNSLYYLSRNSFIINRQHCLTSLYGHISYILSLYRQSLRVAYVSKSLLPIVQVSYGLLHGILGKTGRK
ncbi:MAG: GT2 family glycosyltransferase [Cognaticolwellia sp.]|jgi:GT2 family glycosyltransferase